MRNDALGKVMMLRDSGFLSGPLRHFAAITMLAAAALLAVALALGGVDAPVPVAVEASEPTVLPTIKCADAKDCVPYVGETLHADVTGIPDAYGLTEVDVEYGYQWMTNDGSADTDIGGAAATTYTLTSAEVGKTIKVRVSFTNTDGNDETLTSAATATVRVRTLEFYVLEGRRSDGSGGSHVIASSQTISEGLSFYYFIKLSSRPGADVTVTPANSSSAVGVNTGSDRPLTFTSGNWSVMQAVQVFTYPGAGGDENAGSITHTVSSADSTYHGLAAAFDANIVGTNSECTASAAPALTVRAWQDSEAETKYFMRVKPDLDQEAACGDTPIVGYDTAIQKDNGEWQYSPNSRWAVPSAATYSVSPVVQSHGVLPGSTYRVKLRGITYRAGVTPWSPVVEVAVQPAGGL